MRIATLDIGTNTVLLLIVEVEGQRIRVLRDDHAIARLGEGVDRTHRINNAARERFLAVLTQHAATIAELGVTHISAIATSALRDAENRDEIIRAAKGSTGITVELLSGDDEAQWTYRGALLGAQISPEDNLGVLDIGGGSTELSSGTGFRFVSGVSMDIGAVRITERCFGSTPIAKEAVEPARLLIRETLHSSDPNRPTLSQLIAVAGTPTTLATMDQQLQEFDKSKVQNYILRREAVSQLLDILLSQDTATLLERYPAINKARADILPAGALILAEAMDYCEVNEVRVSTRGLRYGIAIREAERLTGTTNFTILE